MSIFSSNIHPLQQALWNAHAGIAKSDLSLLESAVKKEIEVNCYKMKDEKKHLISKISGSASLLDIFKSVALTKVTNDYSHKFRLAENKKNERILAVEFDQAYAVKDDQGIQEIHIKGTQLWKWRIIGKDERECNIVQFTKFVMALNYTIDEMQNKGKLHNVRYLNELLGEVAASAT